MSADDVSHVGHNIVLARRQLGISQRRLALLIDGEVTQISEWERDIHAPNGRSLRRLSRALGHDVDWFMIEHADEQMPDEAWTISDVLHLLDGDGITFTHSDEHVARVLYARGLTLLSQIVIGR